LTAAAIAIGGVVAGVFVSGGGAGTTVAAPTKITVSASEFKFALSKKTVPAGTTVQFTVINKGKILVDDVDVHAKETNKDKLRQKLGMVFQQWNSFPHMTVLENAALAPRIVKKMSKEEAIEIAKKELEHVGLGDKFDVYPAKMSGGQQQRLAIARALAMKPDYMLLDEVTSALDPELVGEVLDTLRLLAEEGMTMICVTHEMGFARDVSDRVAYFHEGVIAEIGEARQVITDPQNPLTQKFLSKVR